MENSRFCLLVSGLDPSGYRHAVSHNDHDEDDALLGGAQISDEERFQNCERLKFKCPNCGREIILDSVVVGAVSKILAVIKNSSSLCLM